MKTKPPEQFVFNFNPPQPSSPKEDKQDWHYNTTLEWNDDEEGYAGSFEEAMDSLAPDGYDQGFGSDNCS